MANELSLTQPRFYLWKPAILAYIQTHVLQLGLVNWRCYCILYSNVIVAMQIRYAWNFLPNPHGWHSLLR